MVAPPSGWRALAETYQRQLVHSAWRFLGAALAFILTCLGPSPATSAPMRRPRAITSIGSACLAAAGVGAGGRG